MTAKTTNQRSLERYKRAARVLPPTTLNETEAAALDKIQAATGENKSVIVRRLIVEEGNRSIQSA